MLVESILSSPAPRTIFARSPLRIKSWISAASVRRYSAVPSYGTTTPIPENSPDLLFTSPYRFETGYALSPKRPSRPFPPPFLSPPSTSFSDPLTTHFRGQDRRLTLKGDLIRGLTNGDDAVLVAENFIGVNDGVGAWATRPHGHAAYGTRMILLWNIDTDDWM